MWGSPDGGRSPDVLTTAEPTGERNEGDRRPIGARGRGIDVSGRGRAPLRGGRGLARGQGRAGFRESGGTRPTVEKCRRANRTAMVGDGKHGGAGGDSSSDACRVTVQEQIRNRSSAAKSTLWSAWAICCFALLVHHIMRKLILAAHQLRSPQTRPKCL